MACIKSAAIAVCVGDLMMLLYQQTKPYEVSPGETDKIYENAKEYVCKAIKSGKAKRTEIYSRVIEAFKRIKTAY